MEQANQQLFQWVNHWPESFSPAMRFLSTATDYLWFKLLLAALVVGMIAWGKTPRRAAIQALLAFPLANGFTDLFKHFAPTHRPFQELSDTLLRVGWSNSAGTASAHSANMAAVATVFALQLGPRWGVPWSVIALMVGVSRVYVGAHFPAQVLLGWCCGIFAGFLVSKGWDFVQTRRRRVVVDRGDDDPEPEPGQEFV